MAYRKHWSAAALTEVTTTSNTVWSDMATLTIPAADQTASKDMFVFWNGAFGNSSNNTSDVQFRVTVDGTAKTTANLEGWRTSPVDYTQTGGFFKITAAGTPVDIVLKIQFKSETSGDTTRSKNTRLAVIEASTADVYQESLARVTKATTGFTDGVSATFTPGSTGNYIALLCGYIDTNATFNGAGDVRLVDGANNTATLGIIGYDTTNLVPFVIGWQRINKTAVSQTIKAQYQAESASVTMGLSEQRLLILREDAFDAVYAATLATDDGNTNATYTDTALVLTPGSATSANDHLQISAWFQEGTSSSLTNYTQLVLDGSSVAEMAHTTIDATNDQSGHGVFVGQISALTAASHTWKVQRKSETTSTFTTVKRDATIFVFDLGTAPSGGAALTGQAVTSAGGTLAPSTAKAISGQSVTASQGTLSPARSVALTGLGITSALGTLAPATSKGLTGSSVTLGQGAVSAGNDVTVALTGQALTASIGTLVAYSSIALSGVAATGSAGSLGRAISVALVGSSATTAQGSITAAVGGDITIALSGQALSMSTGTLQASTGIVAWPLYGATATSEPLAGGTLIANPLSGGTLTAEPL